MIHTAIGKLGDMLVGVVRGLQMVLDNQREIIANQKEILKALQERDCGLKAGGDQ